MPASGTSARQHEGERDEGQVGDDQVEAVAWAASAASRWRALTPSRAVTRGSPRSLACNWPWPTSTPTTEAAPRGQQHVGEAAGALADVQAVLARHVDAGAGQRRVELEPGARHPAQLGVVGDLDLAALGQVFAGLARQRPACARRASARRRLDQPLRGRPASAPGRVARAVGQHAWASIDRLLPAAAADPALPVRQRRPLEG